MKCSSTCVGLLCGHGLAAFLGKLLIAMTAFVQRYRYLRLLYPPQRTKCVDEPTRQRSHRERRVVNGQRKRRHAWTLLICTGFSALTISTWAQIRVTDGNIPFLYESRADVRAPDHKLAEIISTDYRNADDEFTRHDLLQQLKPVIESRLSQARQAKQIYLLIGDNLGNYDFERSAFPTDMGENTLIRFGYDYQVRFDNADQIAFIPLPPEEARSFASALRRSRAVTFRVEGTISRVAEDWDIKIVYMNVAKIVLSMKQNRRQIASHEIQLPTP